MDSQEPISATDLAETMWSGERDILDADDLERLTGTAESHWS